MRNASFRYGEPTPAVISAFAFLIATILTCGRTIASEIDLSDVAAGNGGFITIGGSEGERAGYGTSLVGDVNADGYDDFILTPARFNPRGETEWRAYVVFGSDSSTPVDLADIETSDRGFIIHTTDPDWSLPELTPRADGAGDFNGDGYDDIVIAVNKVADPVSRVFIVYGKPGFDQVDLVDIESGVGGLPILAEPDSTYLSTIIVGGGDLNGDGFSDIALAGDADGFIVFGRNIPAPASISLEDIRSEIGGFVVDLDPNSSGWCVSLDGDFNGDGLDDLLFIQAPYGGRANLIYGKITTEPVTRSDILDGSKGFSIDTTELNNAFERIGSGDIVGDVNGDGFDDLVLCQGSYEYAGVRQAGRISVIFGRTTSDRILLSDIENGIGGYAITPSPGFGRATGPSAGIGDYNNDGRADFVIGSYPYLDNPGSLLDPLRLTGYVVYGKSTLSNVTTQNLDAGIGGFPIRSIPTTTGPYDTLDAGGDINGDGRGDILFSFPSATPLGRRVAGMAMVVSGAPVPAPDADGDQLSNYIETHSGQYASPWFTGTNPSNNDTDADGTRDAAELAFGTDPTNREVSPAPQGLPNRVSLTNVAAGAGGFAFHGTQTNDATGTSVSHAGDVNGDGFADVVLGAPNANTRGEAFVVFGSSSGFSTNRQVLKTSGRGFKIAGFTGVSSVGYNVAGGGDINGDGLDDVLVGAKNASGPPNSIYVVFGKPDTADVPLRQVFLGDGGFVVDCEIEIGGFSPTAEVLGDMNNDGLADMFIQRTVLFGKADGTRVVVHPAVDPVGESGFNVLCENMGSSDAAGDVNGDGREDLIVWDYRQHESIAAVVFGKADTDPVSVADLEAGIGGFVIETGDSEPLFPFDVVGIGDVNGDGLSDVAFPTFAGGQKSYIDAPNFAVVFGKQGTQRIPIEDIVAGNGAYLIHGNLDFAFDFAGWPLSLGRAGDVNRDGLADLILGSPNGVRDGHLHVSTAFVVFGKRDTSPIYLGGVQRGTGGVQIDGVPGTTGRIRSVDTAGDVNADGFDDVIIGAPDFSRPGQAYVVHGFRPKAVDSDHDLIPDYAETGTGIYVDAENTGTNRNTSDTDGDGVIDGIEVSLGTDPTDPLDVPLLPLRSLWTLTVLLGSIAAVRLAVPRLFSIKRFPRQAPLTRD